MANIINDGVSTTPTPGAKTLAFIVSFIREKLGDKKTPYGWSDEFLTECVNEAINELCTEMQMIVDAATASICTHVLAPGAYGLTLSERITGVQRVELASIGRTLEYVTDIAEMDALYPDWKSTAAGVPRKFIKDGLGENIARLWPATLLGDTVNLTVSRLPLFDLTWNSDQATIPELPAMYHDKIYDGILYRAYQMNDTDTDNKRKADEHERKWKAQVEKIRRAHLYKGNVAYTAAPHPGWM